MKIKLLLTGGDGMLGTEVRAQAEDAFDVVSTDVGDMDVTDGVLVHRTVEREQPHIVLHAGAMTNVDGCEEDPDQAYRVNALGTRNVTLAAAAFKVPVVYVSTDYVFDGTGGRPYIEFDPVGPRSVYGRSKLAGEEFVRQLSRGRFFIVRTQWVYGFGGRNFVDTILGAAEAGRPLRVVDDQFGSPTWARDLAAAILRIIGSNAGYGTYHCSSSGACSWFEFTKEILRVAGVTPASLDPMPSTELDRPAPRPAYSVMRNWMLEQTIGDPMPAWQDAVAAYLAARGANQGT